MRDYFNQAVRADCKISQDDNITAKAYEVGEKGSVMDRTLVTYPMLMSTIDCKLYQAGQKLPTPDVLKTTIKRNGDLNKTYNDDTYVAHNRALNIRRENNFCR